MYKSVLLMLGCIALVGCTEAPTSTSDTAAVETTKVSFNTEGAPTVEFSVPDMMCEESCAKAVHETLAAQPGAVDVLVDFPNRVATVAVEKDKFDTDAALASLLDKQFSNSKLMTGAEAAAAGEAGKADESAKADDATKAEETKEDALEKPASEEKETS